MLTLEARAKVNLGLSVVAKREDGFHDLETLFTRISLRDTLRLEPRPEGVRLEVTGLELPGGPDNLAYRAAERYLAAAGEPGGVAITLEKRIPIAAGLGGGSSDAAAVLRGLQNLYPAKVNLLELGETLGSDAPFFVLDVPAARALGRGELLEPVALPRLELVLANPGLHVSAREAYEALEGFSPPLDLAGLLERLASGKEPEYFNALESGVLKRHPVVAEVLEALRGAGLRGVLMSGSGSTCFGLAKSREHAEETAAALAMAHPGWWVCAAATK